MAEDAKRTDVLQFIFSLFLGLLLVVVIGVGVWTFYPQPFGPNSPDQERLEELYRQQEQLNFKGAPTQQTPAEQRRAREVQDEIDEINDRMSDERDEWAVNTSIILLTFATVLMAISLFLPEHMRVFSNGILLGGLFTVLYGTGWSFAGGDSRARFFVVLVALMLSIVFGYLRFIRGRRAQLATTGGATTVAVGAAATTEAGWSSLEARVTALEDRAAAAAEALSGKER